MFRFSTTLLIISSCWITADAWSQAESAGPAALPREVIPEYAGSPTAAWIWKAITPGETEQVYFRREFQLPLNVEDASITILCDNWYQLFVNGVDLGVGVDWSRPASYHVLTHLKPGEKNLIAVEGRNQGGAAGMVLRLCVTLKDGKKLTVVTDGSWQCTNEAAEGWHTLEFSAAAWPKAVAVAKMGDAPWGALMPLLPE